MCSRRLFAKSPCLGLLIAVALVLGACGSPTQSGGAEFRSIFDGATLSGWEGNPAYWRVENGVIIGETTPATLLASNTFIVWRGGRPKDFELKLQYRISTNGNSGINYRSSIVPDSVTPQNQFAMRGYQCDIDGMQLYTGNNYEERGRLFLALRGQSVRLVTGQPPIVQSTLGDSATLASFITQDWNDVHITADGNRLTHVINGRTMTIVIDDDAANRPVDGLIGMQVHAGPAMKVEYRSIQLKEL
jgi:hypothetical protein